MKATICRNPCGPVSVRIIGDDGKTYYASFERESDAVLFTAAPEMREALRIIRKSLQTGDGTDMPAIIESVLAKAEGRA